MKMNWRLAKTEADYQTAAQLLETVLFIGDAEVWLLDPGRGVALFTLDGSRWVLERVWIKPELRRSGITAHAVEGMWETRYGSFGIRDPAHFLRAALRKRGWRPGAEDIWVNQT